MDSWQRCQRAMGFVAMIVGAAFLALAAFVIYEADYSVSRGFIALLITGAVGIAVGLFMSLSAGDATN